MYQGKTHPISAPSAPYPYCSALSCWAGSALRHCLGNTFASDTHLPHAQTENLLGSYFPKKISELDAFLKVLGLGRELESRGQGGESEDQESEEVRGRPLPPGLLLPCVRLSLIHI